MPLIVIIDFCRNYDHVAGLWEHEGWIPDAAVQFAQAHYGAYMVKRTDGLRIITLNTDFCKRSHFSIMSGTNLNPLRVSVRSLYAKNHFAI
jgi:sphingomyelin phosphodiesterase